MCGKSITLADLTWYPTAIVIEYIMPKVFKWP